MFVKLLFSFVHMPYTVNIIISLFIYDNAVKTDISYVYNIEK